jgi:hypothetical protein
MNGTGGTKASNAEQDLSRLLRVILADLADGASFAESEHIRRLSSDLEWFLTEVFDELYPEWKWQFIDGVHPFAARKTGDGEAELFGACDLLPGGEVLPLHIRLQVAATTDVISWLECKLGERGQERQARESLIAVTKRLNALDLRADRIDWLHKVTFGERRL